jgi:bifunctional non-homologous end joining protein LigD
VSEPRTTRPDQLWWPDAGVRKRDVVEYYRAVSPVLLPHLVDRPFTIKRHYNGPRSPFVWLKDAPPELPPWLGVTEQPAKSRGGGLVRYPFVRRLRDLLWLVDFGAIVLHVWASRRDLPERPDYVLFDLDPHGVPFADVVAAARLVRDGLAAFGLASFVKTTGGGGLHVQVPIARRHTHGEAREVAGIVASAVARVAPDLVTLERSPAKRRGVYVDTKMNGHGQQHVAVYSVRPGPVPAVATPVDWAELDGLDPLALTMPVVLDRVARLGDLHAAVLQGTQRLNRLTTAIRSGRRVEPGR